MIKLNPKVADAAIIVLGDGGAEARVKKRLRQYRRHQMAVTEAMALAALNTLPDTKRTVIKQQARI